MDRPAPQPLPTSFLSKRKKGGKDNEKRKIKKKNLARQQNGVEIIWNLYLNYLVTIEAMNRGSTVC